jgi:hypothetical protein
MKRLAADQIKQIEYEILIEFDRICKQRPHLLFSIRHCPWSRTAQWLYSLG